MSRTCILLLFSWMSAFANVSALYLTWHTDPTSTIEIYWHTPDYEKEDLIYVQMPDLSWHEVTGSHTKLHYLNIHSVHLTNLVENTAYSFRIGQDPTIYKFKTAPSDLHTPIRFIIGGDADYSSKLFKKMNAVISAQNPLFCVIGGDIAYAIYGAPQHRLSSPFNRWISFLFSWTKELVTQDGFIIPFLLVAGNHDISQEKADLFFSLFPFPSQKLYRSLEFGSYLQLLFLDTDHLSPIEGEQTAWLEKTLQTPMPFRFAIYHEAAYPSYYPYDGEIPEKIRTFWCPLFDQYEVNAVFENHNHTFKKTHPLKNQRIDPKGIIYFGDGCWGTPPRKPKKMWYLETAEKKNNVYLVEMNGQGAEIRALDLSGKSFDMTMISPKLKNLQRSPLPQEKIAHP